MSIASCAARSRAIWASTSFIWFFTSKHGLELDENGHWTGRIIDGSLRVRLIFLTVQELSQNEATALTEFTTEKSGIDLDLAICRTVQANFVTRPYWGARPHHDVLGDIATIGWVQGTQDRADTDALFREMQDRADPEDAPRKGQISSIARHPDAETAVRRIGSDGHLRDHLKSAISHLVRTNPTPKGRSRREHSHNIAARLRSMVEQHREEIERSLAAHGRAWSTLEGYLDRMPDLADWWLDLHNRLIKFSKQILAADNSITREESSVRVADITGRFYHGANEIRCRNCNGVLLPRLLHRMVP
jgi:hypothetical protein